MTRTLRRIVGALMVLTGMLVLAPAQAIAAGPPQDDLAALERILTELGTLTDPERRIPVIGEALRRLAPLKGRLADSRLERAQGSLLDDLGQAYWGRSQGIRAENIERAIGAYHEALTVSTRDAFPRDWASTQNNLGNAFNTRIRGDRAENIEQAIAAYQAALTVYSPDESPQPWVTIQSNLGGAYNTRIRGEHADNLEKAITALKAAIAAASRDTFQQQWMMAQINLGNAYQYRIRGDRADNVELAIACYRAALTVATRDALPEQWAMIQNVLGGAWANRIRGDRADNIERAIATFEAALTVRTRNAVPQDWAMSQANLGLAWRDRIKGNRADNLERAIAALAAALTVYSRDTFPQEWAMAQNNLGAAYRDRIKGNRADSLERAIAAIEAALTVQTRDAFPQDWAMAQSNLGAVYGDRIQGDRAANLERAIAADQQALTVYTQHSFPNQWALTQNNLGVAYRDRIQGDRADNLERAIAAYQAALTVHSRDAFPQQWAAIQHNLGVACHDRIQGNRADNLERAIAAFEAALTVSTRDAFPEQWASIQNAMGVTYGDRTRGDPMDNVERAIEALEAALTVYRRDAFPQQWARTQVSVGGAYRQRTKGDAAENRDRAIIAYQAALAVLTRDAFPLDYAATQNNLGNALRDRLRGAPADNLEGAIAAYQAALAVTTRDALPQGWAMTQTNLGTVYRKRLRGQRADNLDRAVAAFSAALTVRTATGTPREYIETSRLLGSTRADQGDWAGARRAFGDAIAAVRAMVGDEFDETRVQGAEDVIENLFTAAAYAEARSGNGDAALALMEEGRARQLRTALRLNALTLTDGQRTRLAELRGDILKDERQLATTDLQGRNAILDRLADRRRQLMTVVKQGAPAGTEEPVAALARRLVPAGGAIVVPVMAEQGAVLLMVAGAGTDATVTVHALPGLTEDRWRELLWGPANMSALGGWLGDYAGANDPEQPGTVEEVKAWRRQITGTAGRLWPLIGRDLVAALAARGVAETARVIWMPPGLMTLVPIGLARDEGGRYLLDRYELVTTPTVRALATAALTGASPATQTLGALVNPTGDLRYALVEGDLVASRFAPAARMVLGQDAAVSAAPVLAALSGKTYWHLATHGGFTWGDYPESPGIALAGGAKLRILDLLTRRGNGPPPRLVVLSACESGLSSIRVRSEEYIGLPMALLAGGARAVLGAQWPVDDLATMFLIARFYELHLGPNALPPATALRQAQLWLRQATTTVLQEYLSRAAYEGRIDRIRAAQVSDDAQVRFATDARPFADPVFWAGFILAGL